MKIILKDVGYNRGYVIGPYLQERPGVNADVILEEGDDQEECALKALHYLKSITDKFHVEANPHIYPDGKSEGGLPLPEGYVRFDKIGIHNPQNESQPIEINLKHEKIAIAIENATTIDELKDVKSVYPLMPVKCMEAYNLKLKQLTNV